MDELVGLRMSLREASSEFRVVKNTLARLAFAGTEMEPLSDACAGPTAVAFSCADPATTAKILTGFAKEQPKLDIKCGVLGGTVMNLEAVQALATLPSLDVLRGRIIGMLNAPATKIARILTTPATQVARVIEAHSAQGEG